MGRVPIAWPIWMEARGQSLAKVSASAEAMPSKAFFPVSIESGKNSFFMAQVPSWPEHCSTILMAAPGIKRIMSRER